MRGYSTGIGSFTFMIISARCPDLVGLVEDLAPAGAYCSSVKPLPSPAPFST